MLNFLLPSGRKKTLQRMEGACLVLANHKNATTFRTMAMLVLTQTIRNKHLSIYLNEMQKISLSPQLILKYSVFIHIHMQERAPLDNKKIILFLNKLWDGCSSVLQKLSKGELKDSLNKSNKSNRSSICNKSLNKSLCNRSNISTHSEDTVINKQNILITGICRPYLAYLMKLLSIFQSYRCFQRRGISFQKHQVWMMTNLLKTISSITSQFTNIGRYYMKDFGHLIVLLSKTLSRDIHCFVEATGRYIENQGTLLSCIIKLQKGQTQLGQFVRLLQQVSDLNEKLLPVYFGKYFFQSMRDIPEPKWVNINSEHFETIFKLHEIWIRGEQKDRSLSKRRGRRGNRILVTQ